LQRVIDAWETLPEHVRGAIQRMIDAEKKEVMSKT
jgi:hypothetical protein